jgi:hypothetical protein
MPAMSMSLKERGVNGMQRLLQLAQPPGTRGINR